jgi:hypothetical protein
VGPRTGLDNIGELKVLDPNEIQTLTPQRYLVAGLKSK